MAKSTQQIRNERNRKYIEAIAGFDGLELLFASGYRLTISLALVEITEDCPHGYSYAFNLFAPDSNGKPVLRVLGADNAHAPVDRKHPHDHWHATKFGPAGQTPVGIEDGKHVVVKSIEDHIGKFIQASQALLSQLGLPIEVVISNTRPRGHSRENEGPVR